LGGVNEARAGLTPPQQNIFNAIIHSCEKKLFACYTDKDVAQAVIDLVLSQPPERVAIVCNDSCNSDPIDGLGELRRTSNCADAQCSQICQVLGGIQDNDIEQLIDQKNFNELGEVCQLGVPEVN